MQIIFLPKMYSAEEIHGLSVQLEDRFEDLALWKFGQVKDIDENLTVKLKDGTRTYLTDALLLSPSFIELNPYKLREILVNENFVCSICGTYTEQEYFENPMQFHSAVSLWLDDTRYCKPCFDEHTIYTPDGFVKKPENKEEINNVN
jgi:hypothetical protein